MCACLKVIWVCGQNLLCFLTADVYSGNFYEFGALRISNFDEIFCMLSEENYYLCLLFNNLYMIELDEFSGPSDHHY